MLHRQLIDAIESRQVLIFRYKDGRLRVVEPCSYCMTGGGAPLLRAYQRSGYSLSGQPRGWKTFRADLIQSIEHNGEHFTEPQPGYEPFGVSSISAIFAMIPQELPEWLTAPTMDSSAHAA